MKIFDSWDSSYKTPFGALKTGESCKFTLRLDKNIQHDGTPVMIVFKAGFKERFIIMSNAVDEGDCIAYSCSYSENLAGIYYYYFSFMSQGQRKFVKKTSASEAEICDGGSLFQLTVFDANYKTPDFLKGGVIYQIFPDRFAKSGKVHEDIPYGRVMRENWSDVPYFAPDENGHVWNNDYFGGDLLGIEEKLPYLKSLGVSCIYLNPIFEAHENHRYNTANYLKVDPLLGTNEDFKHLCDVAKNQYDISIILDGVFSHTGADSIYFNKFGRYGDMGAYKSQNSEFYPWYSFFDYPNGYEAWWGIDTLPNVIENNEKYTEYICGTGGVLQYWLSLGASGWRLDVADELPDEFLDNLRKSVKSFDENKIVIGEVWEDASNKESYGAKRRYLLGAQLDSVMNYPFRSAILDYCAGGSAENLKNSVQTILENYPKPAVDVLMNFISTHDVERAINVLGGQPIYDKSKEWQSTYKLSDEEYAKGKSRLKIAMILQFFLPGVPSIYYGDEAGMQGCKDPFNRMCYPWGNEDNDLIEHVQKLSQVRAKSKVFKNGTLRFLQLDDDLLIFARENTAKQKSVVIFVNRSNETKYVDDITAIIGKCEKIKVLYGNLEENALQVEPNGFAAVKVFE